MISVLNAIVPLQTNANGIIEPLAVLAVTIVIFAGFWKTFEKAGEPGWAGIIPIYNLYVLNRISGNAWWWFLLFFVPVINFFALGKISINVAEKFNRGVLFGLGLMFLSFIFYPVLGFGGYQYQNTTQLS
ncbi:DUF5684 domain-containing protein [Halorientalis regularis]|jgi:hypothetical protein|uniref:Signal peptidase I n=1 Tax=Halorientalis regularis TaxID=660518 RepID=A0A1G7HNG8_9EURY|nr:DUF5684 domain-containing protein [Halorientalis regularis]SDF01549.1 hypothetical protein SAMN05216218_10383 [Halorientalis regularis]